MKITNIQDTILAEKINDLIFLESKAKERVDIVIVLGNNYVKTMDVLPSLVDEGIIDFEHTKVIVTGHSAKVAITDEELEVLEKLKPYYEQLLNKAQELGITGNKIELPIFKKAEQAQKTLRLRRFTEPEYKVFIDYAIEQLLMPKELFVEEEKATNAKENIENSFRIIDEKLGGFERNKKILVVCKAFITRRVEMAIRAQSQYADKSIALFFEPIVDKESRNIASDVWWQERENSDAWIRVMEEVMRLGQYTAKGDLSL